MGLDVSVDRCRLNPDQSADLYGFELAEFDELADHPGRAAQERGRLLVVEKSACDAWGGWHVHEGRTVSRSWE